SEPYTPLIESLRLGYTASSDAVFFKKETENDFLADETELFHVGAFGQMREHCFLRKQLDFVSDKNVYLFPQYVNEGEFYIGVKDIKPQQNLTLFFQVAEGSANPEKKKQTVRWSTLIDNHWRDFIEKEVVSDLTNGLLKSGIIKFAIPEDATQNNTLLPAGYYWLRAIVPEHTDAVCRVLAVETNSAIVEFCDNNNHPDHFKTPLAAGTIQKMENPVATIKSVSQPYASFGGRMAEDDTLLAKRSSERLRHKERATCIWDYERLVLQNFPDIYRVKCLSHTSPQSANAPGHVTVLVIPNLGNRNSYNPLQPRVDLNTLTEIQKILVKRSGFFLDSNRIHVENPQYEPIHVDTKVSFREGYEFSYYMSVLINDIKKMLTPWAFDDSVDITFGGQVHKSTLIKAIEDLSYVDFIEDLKMFQSRGGIAARRDITKTTLTNGKVILVSSETHTIGQTTK
ncbi:MAG: baseplate J/gp47 family protein, partial [Planctomycetota bacterium]